MYVVLNAGIHDAIFFQTADACVRPVTELLQARVTDSTKELLVRFATNGAEITRAKNTIRGIIRIVNEDRNNIPQQQLQMSLEDEMTVYLYMGNFFISFFYLNVNQPTRTISCMSHIVFALRTKF